MGHIWTMVSIWFNNIFTDSIHILNSNLVVTFPLLYTVYCYSGFDPFYPWFFGLARGLKRKTFFPPKLTCFYVPLKGYNLVQDNLSIRQFFGIKSKPFSYITCRITRYQPLNTKHKNMSEDTNHLENQKFHRVFWGMI